MQGKLKPEKWQKRPFLIFHFFVFFTIFLVPPVVVDGGQSRTPGIVMKTESADAQQIWQVVHGAVEDQSWWTAGSENEVHEILSLYYAGPLLENYSRQVWAFISRPTDWYTRAEVTGGSITRLTDGRWKVRADLVNRDLRTGETGFGRATYILAENKNGWRIIAAEYSWNDDAAGRN